MLGGHLDMTFELLLLKLPKMVTALVPVTLCMSIIRPSSHNILAKIGRMWG